MKNLVKLLKAGVAVENTLSFPFCQENDYRLCITIRIPTPDGYDEDVPLPALEGTGFIAEQSYDPVVNKTTISIHNSVVWADDPNLYTQELLKLAYQIAISALTERIGKMWGYDVDASGDGFVEVGPFIISHDNLPTIIDLQITQQRFSKWFEGADWISLADFAKHYDWLDHTTPCK